MQHGERLRGARVDALVREHEPLVLPAEREGGRVVRERRQGGNGHEAAGRLEATLTADVRRAAYTRLQSMSFSYFDKTSTGHLISRLTGDISRITEMISWTCIDLGWGAMAVVASLLAMFLVNLKLAIPSVAAALVGSSLGAQFSLAISEEVMKYILFAVLPIAAFFVLNRHLFQDSEKHEAVADRRTLAVCVIAAFVIGMYDGFYGPGTGTFLIIAFTVFAKMTVNSANAQAKVINLTSNIASLTVFLINGQVLIPLGLAAAACNMAGNWVGSGLAISKGARIVRPVILLVLLLLLLKLIFNF